MSFKKALDLAITKGGYDTEDTVRWEAEVLLDPKFFQCLGVAEGWNTWITNGGFIKHIEPTGKRKFYYKPAWLYHWHRFIDALADGKTADEYFNQLLK